MIVCIFGKRGWGKTWYLQEKIVRPSVLPCVIVDTFKEYGDYAIEMPITDDIRFDKFKVRFSPKTDTEFDIVARCVCNLRSRYGINYVVEEVDQFTSSHAVPMNFMNALRYSRQYKINIYLTVRNPSELNRRISALADEFIIFRTTEPIYLRYFAQFDEKLLNVLPKLKVKEFRRIKL